MDGNVNAKLRKIIFWLHLVAGLVAGVVIAIMCFTGATLAFEKDIIAWAERNVRRVTPPSPSAARLPLDDLLARFREAQPDQRPTGITIEADPHIAVLFSFGRTNAFYANPYTGEVRQTSATGLRRFMQAMIEWHRYLGATGVGRNRGKAITGVCNAAFLFLAGSGLYLWWPRKWIKNALRSVTLMDFKLRGKARDWNWHNAMGLWLAPVLIVLTATAMPISYRWATNLIYQLAGSPLPQPSAGPRGANRLAAETSPPTADAKPLNLAALLAAAQEASPGWKQISLRSTGEDRGSTPVVVTVIAKNSWPLFANTQLTLDSLTGAVLRQETFRDFDAGRKVRSWTRFLHTGEALGVAGKAVAGIASAGALLLVWTGFALAWRRFFSKPKSSEPAASPVAVAETVPR